EVDGLREPRARMFDERPIVAQQEPLARRLERRSAELEAGADVVAREPTLEAAEDELGAEERRPFPAASGPDAVEPPEPLERRERETGERPHVRNDRDVVGRCDHRKAGRRWTSRICLELALAAPHLRFALESRARRRRGRRARIPALDALARGRFAE